ncbi:hypothetical protein FGLOB1_1032 [Fusarium globosum]|uniref:Uncharacterized protein n=1 Tax=Fusarium globosum TaxID=78864 RepID=A0A8H6DK49_9HYPO|nr:hypothetical protein FGLOB1_1032 [Fusarium globosum]
MENQATEAFSSMKDLTDALVGGSGWLENPDAADRKRVEKHLDEEANLDSESDFSGNDSDPGVCQNAVVQ